MRVVNTHDRQSLCVPDESPYRRSSGAIALRQSEFLCGCGHKFPSQTGRRHSASNANILRYDCRAKESASASFFNYCFAPLLPFSVRTDLFICAREDAVSLVHADWIFDTDTIRNSNFYFISIRSSRSPSSSATAAEIGASIILFE